MEENLKEGEKRAMEKTEKHTNLELLSDEWEKKEEKGKGGSKDPMTTIRQIGSIAEMSSRRKERVMITVGGKRATEVIDIAVRAAVAEA
ncbi:unnamed protein product [Heligmosomoides polygyrus]|uniref:Alba domain-containing protein n=1 Tax=Heligmosomoides polygyrus TaxID=6339 RepID=A0A183F3K0_HELPZ|nr:unnamed protein product [Heligmosomoides polygyrus]